MSWEDHKVELSKNDAHNINHTGGYIVSYAVIHADGESFGSLAISVIDENAGNMLNYILAEAMKSSNCERDQIRIVGIFKL